MSAQPIDFSKYESAAPQIDFSKYETSTQPSQPSAASRLGSGFLSGAGVVSQQQGKDFFVHPVDALKAMAAQQGELGERAGKELQNGDYVRGLTHGVEWLLPGLGPVLAKSGDQLESGDIAGGIGTTLGAASNIMAAHYAPAATGAVADAATAVPAKVGELLDAAKQVTPKQAAQVVGAGTGAGLGHGALSIPGAYYGAKGAGSLAEGVLGKERANAPIITPKAPVNPGAPAPKPPTIPDVTAKANNIARLSQLLNDSMGGKGLEPNVPIKNQGGIITPQASELTTLPEGHIPVDSSALKSYKYDPLTREFESVTTNGSHYIHGDVDPAQVAQFEAADSKGRAWNELRKNSTLVAKVVNGKRVPVKPVISEMDSIPEDEWTAGHDIDSFVEGSPR
jgi:KTSC domain